MALRAGRAVLASLMLAASATADVDDADSGRNLLFSDPSQDLPDIMLSESVVYVTEGNYFYYTVSLTHQPGMREDKTIDLTNDEVRIYLTSSQEVYQQDDVDSSNNNFVQAIGHRSQLIINTGIDSVAGSDEKLRTHSGLTQLASSSMQTNFPTPYVYVAYSTVNPQQASPIDGTGSSAIYKVICPKCTHKAYCYQGTASEIITGTVITADSATNVAAFAGCRTVISVFFAPILDLCTPTHTQYVSSSNAPENCIMDAGTTGQANNDHLKVTGFDGFKGIITPTQLGGDATPKTGDFQKDIVRNRRKGSAMDGSIGAEVTGIQAYAAGSSSVGTYDKDAGTWTQSGTEAIHDQDRALGSETATSGDGIETFGSSDYRIQVDGSHVHRTIPKVEAHCRYCEKPGIKCEAEADVFGAPCRRDVVNGGDQAPQENNWLQGWGSPEFDATTSYASLSSPRGSSWRGDLSSSAQLVFDSTNWDTPQTVKVIARDDNVYEPEVFGRGQDAYVHHYVVAQDINNQHQYYENLDVNDLVVSITDNDPALVLQEYSKQDQTTKVGLYPGEGQDYHQPLVGHATTVAAFTAMCTDSSDSALASIVDMQTCLATTGNKWLGGNDQLKIKLASEPMYDVTVYVQSGGFLTAGTTTSPSTPTALEPDDEDVIFQDVGQY